MSRGFATDSMLLALRGMIAAEKAEAFEDAEIVCSARECWLGDTVVASRTVDRLLEARAISDVSEGAQTRRYALNGTGRAISIDPKVADDILAAIRRGGAFDETGKPIDPVKFE